MIHDDIELLLWVFYIFLSNYRMMDVIFLITMCYPTIYITIFLQESGDFDPR